MFNERRHFQAKSGLTKQEPDARQRASGPHLSRVYGPGVQVWGGTAACRDGVRVFRQFLRLDWRSRVEITSPLQGANATGIASR
ncbi:MAG TPA: hypothetical protein VK249_32860 [Anaerolineales bacterium]|nr:hypothetical protein [Anaerolineales bacterium]